MSSEDRRGTVVQANLPLSRRQHRSQIRILEANPPGGPPFDGWHNIQPPNPFQNGWFGGIETFALDPPVGYGKSSDGNWVHLRGQLARLTQDFDDGSVAFNLPVGYRPPYRVCRVAKTGTPAEIGFVHSGVTFWKGGSGGGHVIIEANGDVKPYLATTGYGAEASYNFDPFTFAAPDTFLNPLDWVGPVVPVYAYQAGGTVGFHSTSSSTPEPGFIYLGTGDYADCSISLTDIASTRIKLGLRCQPYNTQFGFADAAGTWMRMSSTAGPLLAEVYYVSPLGGIQNQFPFASPGYGPGDVITFFAVADQITVVKNNTLVFQLDGMPNGSGMFGMGVGGASGIPLARDFVGGLPYLDVSLDGIYFNVNP